MTPKKIKFLRPNMLFRASESFLGPQKHKKLIFSKKMLNSVICLNIGFGFHSGPGDQGTIRPLKTIHLT